MYVVSENIAFSTRTPLILLSLLQKNQHFHCKYYRPRIQNQASKLARNLKKSMMSQLFDMMSSSIFFRCCRVSLVKFSYWSKFHVNIITISGVMTNSVYKGFARNWEITNTLSEFCPISGYWSKLGMPNLAQMFLIKVTAC